MKIVVTGGAGFVGSNAADYFAGKKNEVVVIDNLSRANLLNKKGSGTKRNWDYLKEKHDIEMISCDIREEKPILEAVGGADVIIHAAAQTAVTSSLTNPRRDFEINAAGTFNILDAAAKSGNKPVFIFCSTNKVYGDNVNSIPVKEMEKRYVFADPKYKNGIPESFPVDICEHTPYGCSKIAADFYVQDYALRKEIKGGIFRMSCTYGTRQYGVEDQGWLAWFLIASILKKPIKIYGDGKQVRDVLFVKDLVKAFELFIKESDSIGCGVYNMGGGSEKTLSLLELLEIIEDFGYKPEISFGEWRPSDQKVYISDISKVGRKLRWQPEISPKEGVDELANWIKQNIDAFK
jgi:CDP-paratose 2-epimerase